MPRPQRPRRQRVEERLLELCAMQQHERRPVTLLDRLAPASVASGSPSQRYRPAPLRGMVPPRTPVTPSDSSASTALGHRLRPAPTGVNSGALS